MPDRGGRRWESAPAQCARFSADRAVSRPGVAEALLLIVTNPVDIVTHVAARFAAEYDVAASRIHGSGTTLDMARFAALPGCHFDVDPQILRDAVASLQLDV